LSHTAADSIMQTYRIVRKQCIHVCVQCCDGRVVGIRSIARNATVFLIHLVCSRVHTGRSRGKGIGCGLGRGRVCLSLGLCSGSGCLFFLKSRFGGGNLLRRRQLRWGMSVEQPVLCVPLTGLGLDLRCGLLNRGLRGSMIPYFKVRPTVETAVPCHENLQNETHIISR
jgi:hypothetical protein